MYEPGTRIERDVHTASDLWAYGLMAAPCVDATLEMCMQMPDMTLCENRPESVSRTPLIVSKGLDTIDGVEHREFEVKCDFSHQRPENTTIVYTTNGTLPDIFGPRSPPEFFVKVPVNMSNLLVARCIEPGKTPGRIAYVRIYSWDEYDCPPWEYEEHYKELDGIQECPWWELGYDGCDGQSFLAGYAPEPTVQPSPEPQEIPSSPSTSPTAGTPSLAPSSDHDSPMVAPQTTSPESDNRGDTNACYTLTHLKPLDVVLTLSLFYFLLK